MYSLPTFTNARRSRVAALMIFLSLSIAAATAGPYMTVNSTLRGIICNKVLVQDAKHTVESLAMRTQSPNKGITGTVSCNGADASSRTYSPYTVTKQFDACTAPLYAALANNEKLTVTFEYFDDYFYCTGLNVSLGSQRDSKGVCDGYCDVCNYTSPQQILCQSSQSGQQSLNSVSYSTVLRGAFISSFSRSGISNEQFDLVFKTLEQNINSTPLTLVQIGQKFRTITAYKCGYNPYSGSPQYSSCSCATSTSVYNITMPSLGATYLFKNEINYRSVEQVNYKLPQEGIISDKPYLVNYQQCPPAPPPPPYPPSPFPPPSPPPPPPAPPPVIKGSCSRCNQAPSTQSASSCSTINGNPCQSGAGACSQCESCSYGNGYGCTNCVQFLCP